MPISLTPCRTSLGPLAADAGIRDFLDSGDRPAGIATQIKVEADLRKEDLTRHDLGPGKNSLKRVWEWKEKYGGRIIHQLRRLWSLLRLGAGALYLKMKRLLPGCAGGVR